MRPRQPSLALEAVAAYVPAAADLVDQSVETACRRITDKHGIT
jgi:hypothetical protein